MGFSVWGLGLLHPAEAPDIEPSPLRAHGLSHTSCQHFGFRVYSARVWGLGLRMQGL